RLSVVGRIGPATGRKPPGGRGCCWGVVPAAPDGCSPSAPRWASGTDEVDVTDDATASGDSGANGGDVSGGMRCSISTSPSGPSPSSASSRWCRPTIVWLRCSCFLRICSVSAADSGCCWRWAAAYVRTGGTGRLGGSPSDASDTAEDESPVPAPPPTPPPCAAAAAGTGPCSQNAVRREPWPVRRSVGSGARIEPSPRPSLRPLLPLLPVELRTALRVSNAASVACSVELASEWRESRVALDSTDSDRSRTGVRRDSESELTERGLSSAKVEQSIRSMPSGDSGRPDSNSFAFSDTACRLCGERGTVAAPVGDDGPAGTVMAAGAIANDGGADFGGSWSEPPTPPVKKCSRIADSCEACSRITPLVVLPPPALVGGFGPGGETTAAVGDAFELVDGVEGAGALLPSAPGKPGERGCVGGQTDFWSRFGRA
uniref:Uncharacterized protein n=1 Tax=Anopheles melas TaxID=34690 RepID=A0A182TWR2_9DIPT